MHSYMRPLISDGLSQRGSRFMLTAGFICERTYRPRLYKIRYLPLKWYLNLGIRRNGRIRYRDAV